MWYVQKAGQIQKVHEAAKLTQGCGSEHVALYLCIHPSELARRWRSTLYTVIISSKAMRN